jgi:alkanesulfonate monooxygenase SsuD/methylene tetrahydromethanopterin reductase-like flavin-dependent oxidoreductase (luciferase family)
LSPFDAHAPAIVTAAQAAERAGFGGVWTFDHLSGAVAGRSSVLECFTLLGAFAQATSSVIVGPLVANVNNRHPAVIANAAATLQDLSGGRAWLGLGAGAGPSSPYAVEQIALGRPVLSATARRAQLDEAVQVIRQLWSEDSAQSFKGEYYHLDAAAAFPTPQPPPPIIVGANGPRIAALAGRIADGINVAADNPAFEEVAAASREAAAGPFIVTAYAPFDRSWLDGQRALELGVDRMILLVDAPHELDLGLTGG